MNKKYIKALVVLISLNLIFQLSSFAQKPVVIKDSNGNPIAGASVTIGEGTKPIITNEKGEFNLKVDAITAILVEAEGYDSQNLVAYPAIDLSTIVLTAAPFQMTQKDLVKVPFGSFTKRQISSAVTSFKPAEILLYDNPKDFQELINGRVPGFFGMTDNRGLGTPLVVVDGVPRSGLDYNLQMIDQITVSKDLLSSMMYGGQANNGVIYITTKRGQPLKRNINFTLQSGVNQAISYPKFLSSSNYMTLYNEALTNDGLAPKYTQADIDANASGSDPVRYPNENYYNSTYLKNLSSYYNIVGETGGGNEIAQYYLNIGWNRATGFLKPGEGGNEKKDRINVRGNVDYKLNDVIKVRFDAAAIFNIMDQPRYTSSTSDFWTLSSTLYPNSAPALIPVSLLTDPTLLGAAKIIDGKYILGGTSEYMTNIYGELSKNGPSQINSRLLEMNVGLDFDLKKITEGLSASVFFTYDLQNIFRTDIPNSYAVYQPIYTSNAITSWSKYNVDSKVNQMNLADVSFSRRNGLYGKIDYHKISGDHEIIVNGLGYFDQNTTEGVLQPTKHVNAGVRANYSLKKKYFLELIAMANGSIKLSGSDKWGISPGLGLGWIASEESFLSGNSLINYLKFRTNIAITNNDEYLNVYTPGRDFYTAGNMYYFNHTAGYNRLYMMNLGNPNLGFEKRLNYNLGFESIMLDKKFAIEASYFYYKTYDIITQRVNYFPAYFGSVPYENYGSRQNQGIELGINYFENIGDVRVSIGSNLVYSVPKTNVIDELNYPEVYRRATGKPTDALFGLVATGLFADQAEIDSYYPQTFGKVRPGDIKYEDLNGDNVIDELDQKMIGNSHSRIEYSFNVSLKYKAFELFVIASGQTGASSYFNNPYYWVYGNRKYSDVVLNRWTPAAAETAPSSITYPRLTTLPNDNNFRNSTYWLYKNNWFTLQTVQLTYTLPGKIPAIKNANFFLRGNNLFTASQIKDKSQLNIGTAPQTRFYSVGLSLML
jgi:TonB-linked SusC/RagA family outer membrane protein